jgi:hypothetical protein
MEIKGTTKCRLFKSSAAASRKGRRSGDGEGRKVPAFLDASHDHRECCECTRFQPMAAGQSPKGSTPMLRTKYLQQKNEYSHGHVIVFRIFSELLFAWRNNLNSIPIGGVV